MPAGEPALRKRTALAPTGKLSLATPRGQREQLAAPTSPSRISPSATRRLGRAPSSASSGPETRTPPGPSPKMASSTRPSSPSRASSGARSTRAPMPPAMQHSASAKARPPSAMSWAAEAAAGAVRRSSSRCRASSSRSTSGSPSARPPRSLASSEPASDGRNGPSSAIASPSAPNPSRGPLRVRQLADHADDRRRVDRPAAALVVERHVAADDRHAERAAGVGQPLAPRARAARRCAASRGCRSSGSW